MPSSRTSAIEASFLDTCVARDELLRLLRWKGNDVFRHGATAILLVDPKSLAGSPAELEADRYGSEITQIGKHRCQSFSPIHLRRFGDLLQIAFAGRFGDHCLRFSLAVCIVSKQMLECASEMVECERFIACPFSILASLRFDTVIRLFMIRLFFHHIPRIGNRIREHAKGLLLHARAWLGNARGALTLGIGVAPQVPYRLFFRS